MKKIFFSFHLFLLFFILIKFEILCSSVEDYYFGKSISTDNKNENAEENDCPCDMKTGICDYLCCCDTDCDESEIEHWINQTKCIDQKDSIGIFADRCIDKNLVFRISKRRGLKIDNQTEDISRKEGTTILNYCFSMDNSGKMTKNITSIKEYFTENGIEYNEEKIKMIGDLIYSNEFKNENDTNQINNQDENNYQKYIKFDPDMEGAYFRNSEYFSLYSSSSCQNSKNVEIFKSENYSCMNNGKLHLTEEQLMRIKFANNDNCSIRKRYFIEDGGLLNINNQISCDNKAIVEVEFLLFIENTEIEDCSINIVCTNQNINIFKNSVIFTQRQNQIPYRYSGNGGYLNNFPLKIYSANKNKVYNEFFIVGRNLNGDCRYGNDIYNYLYNIDKPIYFKQDYSYSCRIGNSETKSTILYKKISEIGKVAKYGSSTYSNIDNNPDWINVDTSNIRDGENYVIMNIYIKKAKGLGFYAPKYINSISIKSSFINEAIFKLDIKFIDLDEETNESKYNKEPETPLFIPRIPEDILDPLFYSDVDK